MNQNLTFTRTCPKRCWTSLERAVGTISENSNKIAIILERHETRLDEGDKSNQLIIKMIEEMKATHEKDNDILHQRISEVQKKVDHNAKFVVGAGAVLATLVAALQVIPPIMKVLTPEQLSSRLDATPVVYELHREQVRQSPVG